MLIGSCTNSSHEVMSHAASTAKQALAAGIKAKVCVAGGRPARPWVCESVGW